MLTMFSNRVTEENEHGRYETLGMWEPVFCIIEILPQYYVPGRSCEL